MSIAADTLMVPAAPVRGPAFYFNGVTSKRHDVIVETAANSPTGGSSFTLFADTVGVNLEDGGQTTVKKVAAK